MDQMKKALEIAKNEKTVEIAKSYFKDCNFPVEGCVLMGSSMLPIGFAKLTVAGKESLALIKRKGIIGFTANMDSLRKEFAGRRIISFK